MLHLLQSTCTHLLHKRKYYVPTVGFLSGSCIIGKKSHAPFLFFCLLQTLSSPYWSLLNYFFLSAIQAQFVALPFQPKKAAPDGDNCVKQTNNVNKVKSGSSIIRLLRLQHFPHRPSCAICCVQLLSRLEEESVCFRPQKAFKTEAQVKQLE